MNCKRAFFLVFVFSIGFSKVYSMDWLKSALGFDITKPDEIAKKACELTAKGLRAIGCGDSAKKVDEVAKDVGILVKLKNDPINFLNSVVYEPFKCICKYDYRCQTDEKTGVHYRWHKPDDNHPSKKYMFLFHGMWYSIENYWGFDSVITSITPDYNVVFVEWNSFKGVSGEEETYGFVHLKKMSELLYEFICDFLKDKDLEKVFLVGHSHGNTYAIDILSKFVSENKYIDKLVYLGCKGYFRIDRALPRAVMTLKEMKGYEGLKKYLSNIGVKSDAELYTYLKCYVTPDVFDAIVEPSNTNEKNLIEMADQLEIKHFRLSKTKHKFHNRDYIDMMQEYNKFAPDDANKIPCLLFYADKDEYVGEEFKTLEICTVDEFKKKEEEIKKELEKVDEMIEKAVEDAHVEVGVGYNKNEVKAKTAEYVNNIKSNVKPVKAEKSILKSLIKLPGGGSSGGGSSSSPKKKKCCCC